MEFMQVLKSSLVNLLSCILGLKRKTLFNWDIM